MSHTHEEEAAYINDPIYQAMLEETEQAAQAEDWATQEQPDIQEYEEPEENEHGERPLPPPASYDDEPKEAKGENIDIDLIEWGIEMAENLNEAACVRLSGDKDGARYRQPEKRRTKLAKKFSAYFNQSGFTVSPLGGLVTFALFYFGFPLINAFRRRTINQREAERQAAIATRKAEAEAKAQAQVTEQPDDQPLREAQQRRRRFEVHKSTGCYKYPPDQSKDGYLSVEEATETPSAELLPLIARLEAGELKNADIRRYLGYE